jgi:hypothetical protein
LWRHWFGCSLRPSRRTWGFPHPRGYIDASDVTGPPQTATCLCVCVPVCLCVTDTHRHTDTQTQKHTQTHRHTDTQIHRHRHKQTDRQTHTHTHHTHTHTYTQTPAHKTNVKLCVCVSVCVCVSPCSLTRLFLSVCMTFSAHRPPSPASPLAGASACAPCSAGTYSSSTGGRARLGSHWP